jgi:hypothetical protein
MSVKKNEKPFVGKSTLLLMMAVVHAYDQEYTAADAYPNDTANCLLEALKDLSPGKGLDSVQQAVETVWNLGLKIIVNVDNTVTVKGGSFECDYDNADHFVSIWSKV